MIIEIKCTINVMLLNDPQTIPPPRSVENVSSMKPVLVPKRLGIAALGKLNMFSKSDTFITLVR